MDDIHYYESNFSEYYFQSKFNTNKVVNNIYKNICGFIEKLKWNNYFKNKNSLKLMLIYNDLYIILIIEIYLEIYLNK